MSSTTHSANASRSSRHSDWSHEDARALRWLGWGLAWTLMLGWAGWLSLTVLTDSGRMTKAEEKIEIELRQIHKQLDELAGDVKLLLRRAQP